MGADWHGDGESGHRVHAGILGIHGSDFGVLWRCLSHPWGRFSTGLYPFDDNHVVAAISHLSRGDGLSGASHAIELGIVFLSLILIGAGKYSLDEKLRPHQDESS